MNKASVTLLHSGNQSACNKLQKFLNVSSDISTHTIITCQDIFVPMSAFADHFYMLIQHISLLDSSNLQLSLKLSRQYFLLTQYVWHCLKIFHAMNSFSFEPSIFLTSFLKTFENCGNLIHCRCEGDDRNFKNLKSLFIIYGSKAK